MTSRVGPVDLGPSHCIVNHTQISGADEHVSSCKLMFSSETEDLNKKCLRKVSIFQ